MNEKPKEKNSFNFFRLPDFAAKFISFCMHIPKIRNSSQHTKRRMFSAKKRGTIKKCAKEELNAHLSWKTGNDVSLVEFVSLALELTFHGTQDNWRKMRNNRRKFTSQKWKKSLLKISELWINSKIEVHTANQPAMFFHSKNPKKKIFHDLNLI